TPDHHDKDKQKAEHEQEQKAHQENGNRHESPEERRKVLHSYPIRDAIRGVGIWATISSVISVFAAVWLSVALGLIFSPLAGAILGLVIWAGYFILMAYLDTKALSALSGGLVKMVSDTASATGDALGNIFTPSSKNQAQKLADHTVEKVRDEVFKAVDNRDIDRKLNEFANKLEVKESDYNEMRQQLAKLLDEIEVESHTSADGDEGLQEDTFVKVLENHPGVSRRRSRQMRGIWQELKAARKEGKNPSEQLAAATDRLTPGSKEQSQKFRNRIEEYLKKTDREELNPEAIKREINEIISHPSKAPEIVRSRAEGFNRDTAVQLLAARDDIDEQQANQIVNRVESVLSTVTQSVEQGRKQAGEKKDAAKSGLKESARGVEDRIRHRIDAIQGDEFNYEAIKADLQHIFHHPEDTPEVVRERFSHFDRESLVNLLASREDISHEQAERIVTKLEDTRDDIIARAEKVERVTREKFAQGRQAILHEADDLRRSAAAAASWLFISGLASATAAIIAGFLGATLLIA
ncbi:MAG: hypothetical protein ACOCVG_00920, partial [Verrucomicrobiota bacterium]